MRVFLTKYALSKGIKEVDVRKDDVCGIYYERLNEFSEFGYLEKDIEFTLDAARIKANNMRMDKINDLNKEIDALKKLDFFK